MDEAAQKEANKLRAPTAEESRLAEKAAQEAEAKGEDPEAAERAALAGPLLITQEAEGDATVGRLRED